MPKYRPPFRHDEADIDDATLARYLSGTCDFAQAARVRRWLDADPAHREELARLSVAWNPGPLPEADDNDAMWRAIALEMRRSGRWAGEASRGRRRRAVDRLRVHVAFRSPARLSTWIGLAAAALIIAVGGTIGGLRGSVQPQAVPEPAAMREVATAAGQRATIHLADGSTVTLGVKSRLRFAADRDAHTRDVHLEGEAHFAVTHDSTRPFVVHADGARAVDLGTAFVVRAYSTERQVRVVVTAGQVSLGSAPPGAPPGMVLEAGQLGRSLPSET